MMQFFSKTRNITGLAFLTAPLLALLSLGFELSFWPAFFCGMLFSFFPLRAAMKHLSFRLWIFLCSLSFCCGAALVTQQNPPFPPPFAAALLGLSSCGLLLLLPPWLAAGRYVSASPFLGLAWSCSLLMSVPLRFLVLENQQAFLFTAVILSAAGLVLASGKIPKKQLLSPPAHDVFGSSMVKAVICFLSLLTFLGICLGILLSQTESIPGTLSIFTPSYAASLIYGTSLALGPLAGSIITERKGIYSGCIFSIFLSESALLLLCFSQDSIMLTFGTMILLLAAGTMTVILPVLAFYLCGRQGYIQGLSPLLLCVPVSMLFSYPFWLSAARGEMVVDETAVFLLFLSVMSFVCIFFAWKHRFIILKNNRI